MITSGFYVSSNIALHALVISGILLLLLLLFHFIFLAIDLWGGSNVKTEKKISDLPKELDEGKIIDKEENNN